MTDFVKRCVKHLNHARTKHPHLASSVNTFSSDMLLAIAMRVKQTMQTRETGEDVLISEVYEFLSEAKKDHKSERTLEEAADVIAVILRILMGDIDAEN